MASYRVARCSTRSAERPADDRRASDQRRESRSREAEAEAQPRGRGRRHHRSRGRHAPTGGHPTPATCRPGRSVDTHPAEQADLEAHRRLGLLRAPSPLLVGRPGQVVEQKPSAQRAHALDVSQGGGARSRPVRIPERQLEPAGRRTRAQASVQVVAPPSSLPLLLFHFHGARHRCPQPDEPCPDSRLRRPQRDPLLLADFCRRPPVNGGQHDRSSLFDRQRGQRPSARSAPRHCAGRRLRGCARAHHGRGGEVVRVGQHSPAHPQHVDGEVAGDGSAPTGSACPAGGRTTRCVQRQTRINASCATSSAIQLASPVME